jgi:hypothetical protein
VTDPAEQTRALKAHVRKLWDRLSPGQKLVHMASADVRGAIAHEAFDRGLDQLVDEQREVLKARGNPRLADILLTRFPGLVTDDDVSGTEVVACLTEYFARKHF